METRSLLENVTAEVVESKTSNPHPYELSRTPYPFRYDPDGDLEWIYVLDLDQLSFTVNDKIHFRLDKLPPAEEWLGYVAFDGSNIECVAPWIPEEYRADLVAHPLGPLSEPEQKEMEYYNELASQIEIQTIQPSTWLKPIAPHLVMYEKLALLAAEGFITARYSLITNIHRYFSLPFVFEDLAKDLLTAACHGGSEFTLVEQTARKWTCNVLFNAKPTYNRKRIDYYWFRDRLIGLVRTLENADHLKVEIGIILRWMKEKGLRELTAILWSIRHVAVLVVSGDDVAHSDPIPVAKALGGDREKLYEGLKLIAHYLPMPGVESDAPFVSRLPFDVILRIMDASDSETLAALVRTSKALRYEWLRTPSFGPYRLISWQGEHFNATDEGGRHFNLKLVPRECYKYNARSEYSFCGGEVAFRKPISFVNKYNYQPSYRAPLEVYDYSRIHGYRVFVEPSS